jgi:hypothetical protein
MKADKIWFKHSMTHGIILGLSLCVFEFTALYLGMIFNPNLFNIYVLLISVSVYIAIRKFRENNLNGLINFGDAFLTGLLVCGIAGVVWAIYRFVQFKFTPGLIDSMISDFNTAIEQTTISKDEKQAYIQLYKLYMNPITIALMNTFLLAMGMGGSIVSLLVSLILQRKELPKQIEF